MSEQEHHAVEDELRDLFAAVRREKPAPESNLRGHFRK
jgi:hypothetical protein